MLVAHLEEMHESLAPSDVLQFVRDWKLPEEW